MKTSWKYKNTTIQIWPVECLSTICKLPPTTQHWLYHVIRIYGFGESKRKYWTMASALLFDFSCLCAHDDRSTAAFDVTENFAPWPLSTVSIFHPEARFFCCVAACLRCIVKVVVYTIKHCSAPSFTLHAWTEFKESGAQGHLSVWGPGRCDVFGQLSKYVYLMCSAPSKI